MQPTDLIRLSEAQHKYSHSREWFKARMQFYYMGSPLTAYVSQADVDKAVAGDNQIRTTYPRRDDN